MKATVTTLITIGACALAIPASASAYTVDDGDHKSKVTADGSGDSSQPDSSQPVDGWSYNSISGSSDSSKDSGPPVDGWNYSTLNAGTSSGEPSSPSGTNGSPAVDSGSPVSSTDGFDIGSALVGAGIALALLALGSATLLTLRRRTPMSPSAG